MAWYPKTVLRSLLSGKPHRWYGPGQGQFIADGPNQLWVTDLGRHEALLNREEMEGVLPWAVAAACEKLVAA